MCGRISDASITVFQASQDLSPIYEEIHGGSRSTVSTTSSGSSSGVSATAAAACGKFHYSLFDFAASETTMLSVARGQVVRVIQVTFVHTYGTTALEQSSDDSKL